MQLTAEDARDIADALIEGAKVTNNYLDDNINTISRSDYDRLFESLNSLIQAASSVTTVAVGLAIDDLKNPASELKTAIGNANKALSTLKAVSKVSGIVSSLTDLAAGVIAKHPRAVAKAARSLATLVADQGNDA